MGKETAIIPFGNNIGKRSPAIDPKLPLLRHELSLTVIVNWYFNEERDQDDKFSIFI
jgi:hypothetical protein